MRAEDIMPKLALLPLLVALLPLAAQAEAEDGTLNPDEMSLSRNLDEALKGNTSMTTCASGYLMTKSGSHDMARQLFERCVDDGYTGAMTWLSYLHDNGFGGDMDPDRAADYDRMAA
ncbi:MAG TPA: hypothetical protein DC061_18400, partial [Gemmobacter sp.]|nr:hypothetical protein [Gemmobacter sp.]